VPVVWAMATGPDKPSNKTKSSGQRSFFMKKDWLVWEKAGTASGAREEERAIGPVKARVNGTGGEGAPA
jgi:hypothetical protein